MENSNIKYTLSKQNYTAIFKDGSFRTRKSDRIYSHAFKTSGGAVGFSTSEKLAHSGARKFVSLTGHEGPYEVVSVAVETAKRNQG